MHTNRVYTIFWQPNPLPYTHVSPFETSPSYSGTVNSYFGQVAADSHKFSNVYSVITQYYSGAERHIEYATSFGGSLVDTDPYPSSVCEDKSEGEKLEVCLTEAQLEAEIAHVIETQGWTAGPESIFFIYTPKGVGSCFEEEGKSLCSYSYYCAYHSSFTAVSKEVIWANMPYEATEGCEDGARPEGSKAGPAIDTSSHEHNEAISDPTGAGWWDHAGTAESNPDYGEEVADLCNLAEASLTYGSLLEGSTGYGTPGAFNQAIDAHHYLLQQEWSNAAGVLAAGKTPGGCAQLLLPAVFTPPAGASANAPTEFDGSASGIPEDSVSRYSWEFGDGTSGEHAKPAHTYAAPGDYTVTLTVEDARGNTNTTSQQVHVAAEVIIITTTSSTPSSSSSTTTSSTTSESTTTTTTVTATIASVTSTATTSTTSSVPAHPSGTELATMLGLPISDASLAGTSAITLGHASCPPACSLSVSLYTTVRTAKHHHRASRRVLVGSAHITATAGAAPIAVRLNATGRALLRRSHRLMVQLVLSVTDQQGATTQLTRTLTLTSRHHTAHR